MDQARLLKVKELGAQIQKIFVSLLIDALFHLRLLEGSFKYEGPTSICHAHVR
jgi:hypothetical protein